MMKKKVLYPTKTKKQLLAERAKLEARLDKAAEADDLAHEEWALAEKEWAAAQARCSEANLAHMVAQRKRYEALKVYNAISDACDLVHDQLVMLRAEE